jgi:hypothetical protein
VTDTARDTLISLEPFSGVELASIRQAFSMISRSFLPELLKRFITRDALRSAITHVVNSLLAVRLPQIWGEATTACAADSKKFSAWDQNLLTEWSVRHREPGIMMGFLQIPVFQDVQALWPVSLTLARHLRLLFSGRPRRGDRLTK